MGTAELLSVKVEERREGVGLSSFYNSPKGSRLQFLTRFLHIYDTLSIPP